MTFEFYRNMKCIVQQTWTLLLAFYLVKFMEILKMFVNYFVRYPGMKKKVAPN